MVPLLPLGKRSVLNAPAGETLRAAGAASTVEQSRWVAKSARWDGLLTFDTEGEIIIFVGRNSRFARTLEAVLALLTHFILPSS
jgi:hypothetical protein